MKNFLVVLLVVLSSTGISAQKFSELPRATYSLVGGNYTLDAEIKEGKLVVYEPNRTTPYTKVEGDKYSYWHEKFQKTYWVEIIDDSTLHFTSSNVEGITVLKKVSDQEAGMQEEGNEKFLAIAEKYRKLAENKTDGDPEVQAYTFCAASALAGAYKTEPEYKNYAYQAAVALKLMSAARNPCSDAIPDSVWNSATVD